jgi:hypothetical protein
MQWYDLWSMVHISTSRSLTLRLLALGSSGSESAAKPVLIRQCRILLLDECLLTIEEIDCQKQYQYCQQHIKAEPRHLV